jgi:signal transduction histidine kinase
MTTFLGVPIRRGETVVGSLYLTDKQGGGPFSEADEMAVQALGSHAAVAIHNLQLLSRQRDLVRNLITAQEEERRAVAYDLHDGLTQFVMASHAHLESFRRAHEKQDEARAAREMELGLKYLKEAVVESRRLINGLRLLALDDLGLVGALEQLLNEEKTRAGWTNVEWQCPLQERRFDRSVETGVYRVAQEALTNVRKHAQAARVCVHLELETPSRLRLEVRDWGRGFSPQSKNDEYGHVGLQGMIERVNLLGGHFELHSAPGEGTRVTALFPALEPHPEDV